LAQFVQQARVLDGSIRLPLKCFIPLAGEPRDLCFLAGNGCTTGARSLWRSAVLARSGLSTMRFGSFAACFGAPSHFAPYAKDKAIVAAETSTM
jgi:hypothetical protein